MLVYKQEARIRFRFELLNRADEVVFFNPSVGDQLTSFARLSMNDGPHLKCYTPLAALTSAFYKLFAEFNFKVSNR